MFAVEMRMPGLHRPLRARELSDGTLRYLCLLAALLSPHPPALLALNEPETSLHPDLLPALARLMARASANCQMIVVSHAKPLIEALTGQPECHSVVLEKSIGETTVVGATRLGGPPWRWPER